jgi:hypothetical protein
MEGLISSQLAPHTASIVGVDISQGMVDLYNRRVSNQGITPDEMKAVCVELRGVPGELDDAKFDVIVVRFYNWAEVPPPLILLPCSVLCPITISHLLRRPHAS